MDDKTAKAIRNAISESFDKHKRLEAIYKKVRQGTATYEDAHILAKDLASIMTRELRPYGYALNGDDLSINLLKELYTKHGRLTSMVCDSVQKTLNEAAGIGINPVEPPSSTDRIDGIVKLMAESQEAENVARVIEEPFTTAALAKVDEWVQTNADFQSKIGFSPVIVRKYEGPHEETHNGKKTGKLRDCRFCKDLAGNYNYDEERPADLFVRHLGCRCTVVMYPMHYYEGRITALAKGETDTEGVLWNTGQYTSNSRQAVLRRRRKQYGKDEARRILNEEWKGGRNGQAERHF